MPNPIRQVSAVSLTVIALGAALVGSEPGPSAALSDVSLPGGLPGALVSIGDRAPADRALFLPELIVRFFNTSTSTRVTDVPELQALVSRLERCASAAPDSSCGTSEAVPLPVTPAWWIREVFHGRSTPETLVRDIVRSHDAALLYWSLLTLDGATRSWFAQQPALIAAASGDRAAVLALLAPGLRVTARGVRVPGDERARAAWEALVGVDASDAAGFVERLLDADDGWKGFFLASLAHLSSAQLTAVLDLDATDPTLPQDALRKLYDVFVTAGRGWKLTARPFSRPPLDPLLVLGELRVDESSHRALLPGGREFWKAVFDMADSNDLKPRESVSAADTPVDVTWLLARAFDAGPTGSKLRIDQVQLAQRVFGAAPQHLPDAAVTIAALDRYPSLIRVLDRLGIRDPEVYRQVITRATSFDRISDATIRTRSIAQFQGVLALVLRSLTIGSLAHADVGALMTSLAAESTDTDGEYEGRLARWTVAHLAHGTTDADVEAVLLNTLAGPGAPVADVEWEGTRYHVDLSGAESRRIAEARGEAPPPYLNSALALLNEAEQLTQSSNATAAVQRTASAVTSVPDACGWAGGPQDRPAAYREAVETVLAASRRPARAALARAARSLRVLADELTARGVTELAYAVALRMPDGGAVTSAILAGRHDFGVTRADGARTPVPWRSASQSNGLGRDWNLEGAVLDLDIAAAQRSLVRVSWKPLAQAPSITAADRQALSEVPVLMPVASLTDASRDTLTAALREGRARLARSVSDSDLDQIADAASLDGIRRTLLPWAASHDRDRLPFMLTTSEIFRLGLAPDSPSFDAWGTSARARTGCLCLSMPPTQPRYLWLGHANTGILMSTVPDLNLRITELLAELHMPAVLLPGMLRAATSDLADRAVIRYPDDLRGMTEYIQHLSTDDAEQYLALLTADGSLAPVRASAGLP
jgi:hypothetical protein